MIRSLSLFLYSAIIILLCSSVNASQTLTLSLETPGLDGSAAKTASAAKAASAPTEKKAVQKNTVKVGLVGIIQVTSANIYKEKVANGRKYSTVKAETPLAIVKDEGDWYGILMTNGLVGWVAKKNVKLTGYELMSAKPEETRGNTTSRGGQIDRIGAWAQQLIEVASRYTGIPYVFGGNNPSTGLDCSAFVQTVYRQFGVKLPRTSRQQAIVGDSIPFDQLQAGDRLYFSCKNSHIDHCGIYAGNGYFVHCSKSRNGVGVDSLSSDFYWRNLVVAKRS